MAQLIPAGAATVLDVGAGTGEMAQAINSFRPELNISGVDVYVRPKTFIPVLKYDGNRLPFDDNSVDAVITVDVLHHCDDPTAVLKECARVSRKWVLIKDHVSENSFDHVTLRFMDWVGNRAHGVVLPYNYYSSKQWEEAFRAAHLRSAAQAGRINLYPMPFELLFGGSLHCIHLLEKY
jgi:SAM-dependent methyltransferase